MKKALFVSYHFSDQKAIGSVRINGLAKFLPEFGWQPYILTANLNKTRSLQTQIKSFEAPCEDASIKWKKMLRLNQDQSLNEHLNIPVKKNKPNHIELLIKIWSEFFTYPDGVRSWRTSAVELGDKLMKSESFDAMISSSGPPTCNLIAKDLKEKHGIPWIADFRDLWTQNHYYQFSKLRHLFERRLEMKTLANADALTTVSEPLSDKLKELHSGKPVFSIPNGFDPAQRNPGLPLADKFTITYTGSLYRGRRDPAPFFRVLGNLISKGLIDPNDFSVDFYGPNEDWLEDDAKKHGLDGIVKINGSISRDESIEKQRRSHLLLLLTWNNKEEKGVYTGKVFDYLAASRPILSLGVTGGVVEDLLNATGAGYHPSSQEDIERIIMNAYNEYKSKSTVTYRGLPSEIDKFSHVEMARKFAAVLDDLVETKN